MSLFNTTKLTSMQDLFTHKVKCLYDVELRLVEALPKLRDAASDPKLKAGFDRHLEETREQVVRLEQIFTLLNLSPERVTAEAMKALVNEGDRIISASGDDFVRDAALIGCGLAVEHHEIALYGTARTWAISLGLGAISQLLEETLKEEQNISQSLSDMAEKEIDAHAAK